MAESTYICSLSLIGFILIFLPLSNSSIMVTQMEV